MSVGVVVCAHNEAPSIGAVLSAARGAPSIAEVVTVADACTDQTAQIAADYGEVIVTERCDKGSAMAAGLEVIASPLVLFLDADLRGLLSGHVEALATLPPLGGQVAGMTEGAPLTPLPPITGERRVPADLARSVHLAGSGYRAELAIDAAIGAAGLPWRHLRLKGVVNPSRLATDPLRWLSMAASVGLAAAGHLPGLVQYTVNPGGRISGNGAGIRA